MDEAMASIPADKRPIAAGRRDPPPPRRRGCLRLSCLGCLPIFLLSAAGLYLGVGLLVDPDRDASGWDRLTASTLWAVEARDLAGLIGQANDDPAIRDFILPLVREHAESLAPTELPRLLSADYNPLVLIEALAKSRAFLPNAILAGAVSGKAGRFMLFRPPPLWRWLAGVRDETVRPGNDEFTAAILATEAGKIHMVSVDGWLVVSASPETLKEFVFSKRKDAPPLGPAPAGKRPGLHFAAREKPAGVDEFGSAKRSADDFFPFAPEKPPPAAAPAEDILHRFTLIQIGSAWEGFGVFNAKPAAPPAEKPPFPGLTPPPDKDVLARADISPERLAEWLVKLRAFLADNWPTRLARAGIRPEPWLLDAWLSRVSGEFQLMAARPAAPDADLVPPLPVTSLAWRWRPELDPDAASRDFALAGMEFLAALTGPEAPQPLPLLGKSLSVEERFAPGARLGVINLPPVMANAAKPAWLLPTGLGRDGQAWIASDPAGLPETDGDAGKPSVRLPSASGPGKARLSAAWNLSPAFRKAVLSAIHDRLETLPGPESPWRTTIMENFGLAEPLAAFLSSGRLLIADDGGEIRLLMRLEREK